MVFSGKTDQINWSEFAFETQELFLASVAACDKTTAKPPNVIIQWIEVWWTGGYSLLTMISGLTMVGDTLGGNWGCHPSIFSWKTWRPFLVASSAVSPRFFFLWKTDDLFLLITVTFYWFHSGVTPPPGGCHPAPLLPVRPRFSTIFCKFAHKIVLVSPGAVRPPVPALAMTSRQ